MTQPAHLDACRHGYLPGDCVKESCSHSLRARALYAVVSETVPVVSRSPHRARVLQLAELVAADYDVAASDILSACKRTEYLEPKQVLYWMCNHVERWNWSVTARALERDRTGVMVAARKLDVRARTDTALRERVARLVQEATNV